MPRRTISLPQIQSVAGRDSMLHEILTRLRDAVNVALSFPGANGAETKARSRIVVTNPVTRVVAPGTVRTIEGGDIGVPIWLIAATGDVELAVGGNIGSAVTIKGGTAVGLILESKTGLYWPVGGV